MDMSVKMSKSERYDISIHTHSEYNSGFLTLDKVCEDVFSKAKFPANKMSQIYHKDPFVILPHRMRNILLWKRVKIIQGYTIILS